MQKVAELISTYQTAWEPYTLSVSVCSVCIVHTLNEVSINFARFQPKLIEFQKLFKTLSLHALNTQWQLVNFLDFQVNVTQIDRL